MGLYGMANPLRGQGLVDETGMASGQVESDARAVNALYQLCPIAHQTSLISKPELARKFGVADIWLKLEEQRLGLGSFKALGATYAIAKMAAQRVDANDAKAMSTALSDVTFVCASAGNHGLSMAAGARLFGAKAVVLLSETVPESFAQRLREKNAEVIRAGADYEASMEASKQMAIDNDWHLLSDGSWEGYSDPARDVMEGYLVLGHEIADQLDQPPTHIVLQAGVGGLAAACAVAARQRWGSDVTIIVVEPESALALIGSIKAGRSLTTHGPVSSMGRLDCKAPSHLALKYLAKEADYFVTLDDGLVEDTVRLLGQHGVDTTPSGAAGVSALHHQTEERAFGLDQNSRVVCIISEGPT